MRCPRVYVVLGAIARYGSRYCSRVVITLGNDAEDRARLFARYCSRARFAKPNTVGNRDEEGPAGRCVLGRAGAVGGVVADGAKLWVKAASRRGSESARQQVRRMSEGVGLAGTVRSRVYVRVAGENGVWLRTSSI